MTAVIILVGADEMDIDAVMDEGSITEVVD